MLKLHRLATTGTQDPVVLMLTLTIRAMGQKHNNIIRHFRVYPLGNRCAGSLWLNSACWNLWRPLWGSPLLAPEPALHWKLGTWVMARCAKVWFVSNKKHAFCKESFLRRKQLSVLLNQPHVQVLLWSTIHAEHKFDLAMLHTTYFRNASESHMWETHWVTMFLNQQTITLGRYQDPPKWQKTFGDAWLKTTAIQSCHPRWIVFVSLLSIMVDFWPNNLEFHTIFIAIPL